MSDKILIIEDEADLARILGAYLEVEGFSVIRAGDGKKGLSLFQEETPSLVLLDIMLPVLDGMEVCKEIRSQSDIPVIMISAKSGEMDKVVALGIGADDYVTKPFSPLELVARVKANLRRFHKAGDGKADTGKEQKDGIQIGKLLLNKKTYEVYVGEEPLNLTTKEFDFLYYLASYPGQVFSKEQIYQAVWGYTDSADDNSVTVYVKRLREKLEPYGLSYIKTVWGAGYKISGE